MGRATQGETVQRNLKCVKLKSRVGICQRDSSYAKVEEFKKTLRVEQFAEEIERS